MEEEMARTGGPGRDAIGFNDQVQHAADDDSVSAQWDEHHAAASVPVPAVEPGDNPVDPCLVHGV